MKRINLLCFLALVVSAFGLSAQEDPAASQTPLFDREMLFRSGEKGYHTFRTPALITANNGDLVAICQGRVESRHDYGNIDLVAKISKDSGKSWGPLIPVLKEGEGTWGSYGAVLDKKTSHIHLLISANSKKHSQYGDKSPKKHDDEFEAIDEWGERRVVHVVSKDSGKSWGKPRDCTQALVPKSYTWDAVGPGIGIQILHGDRKGRLVIPAIGRNLYSDDHGKTWKYEMLPRGTSESAVVEYKDGLLMRNDRGVKKNAELKRRFVSKESAPGKWSGFTPDRQLIDPVCQASMLRYTGTPEKSRLLFFNPAMEQERSQMRLRMSYDGGKTWPVSKLVSPPRKKGDAESRNHGGYSSIAKTHDLRIGMLYEYNDDIKDADGGRSVIFAKANLGWLLN